MEKISNPVFNDFNNQRQFLENNIEAKNKKKAKFVAAASFIGAVAPLVIYNIKKGKISEIKDVFEKESSVIKKIIAPTKLVEVDGIKGIGLSVGGSIIAGILSGCKGEKSKENRKQIYKEGLYGFMNCMIPMGIIGTAEKIIEKNNIKTGILGKALMVIGGVTGGVFVANKVANGVNKAIFKEEKQEKFEKRKVKPTDFLVHMDDVIAVMVMAKVPFANHIGKALPFIFTHVGYETGTKPFANKK